MKKIVYDKNAASEKRRARRGRLETEALRAMALPESTSLKCPCVNLISDTHLEVENHAGVLEFSERMIRLRTSLGILRIEGRRLNIRNAEDRSMLIDGSIGSIAYEDAN